MLHILVSKQILLYMIFCYLKLKTGSDFSKNRKYFVTRQAFISFQHGFVRSGENGHLHNLVGVVWENVNLHNITNAVYCGFMQMLYLFLWQMLLPIWK